MRGQNESDRRRGAGLFALTFEDAAHGVGMRHIAQQGLEDGVLQRGGAVALEQAHQGGGDGAEIATALGGADEQGSAGGHRLGEEVVGPMLAGGFGKQRSLCSEVWRRRITGVMPRASAAARLAWLS
jgi:hypothetical protein